MVERIIYDAEICPAGTFCPKFVFDESTKTVSLIDKQGNRANISIEDFNKFVRAVISGEIRELTSMIRK